MGMVKTILLIVLGSLLYALGTQFFIFSSSVFLGGTSGISVILNHFFPTFSSGTFLSMINVSLMVLALLILGKSMAFKTFLGSTFTTFFIWFLDRMCEHPSLIENPILSAMAGASVIAVASGILFYIDSSSGGTDIIALIVRKFTSIRIGRALFIADVLIVATGALVSGFSIAVASVIGLFIKTFGVDFVIKCLSRKRA